MVTVVPYGPVFVDKLVTVSVGGGGGGGGGLISLSSPLVQLIAVSNKNVTQ